MNELYNTRLGLFDMNENYMDDVVFFYICLVFARTGTNN